MADDFAKTLKKSVIVELDDKEAADEQVDGDYVVDEKRKTATLTESGIQKAEAYFQRGEPVRRRQHGRLRHHINQAIKARGVMHRDIDYVVKDGEVIIVDEFTGRLMYGRRYNEGLHQAIEAKEGVNVASREQDAGHHHLPELLPHVRQAVRHDRYRFQTEADEFSEIYGLQIVEYPHQQAPWPVRTCPTVVYKTDNGQVPTPSLSRSSSATPRASLCWWAPSAWKRARPLLQYAQGASGIQHNVLNAKQHEREAEIVAQAGKSGRRDHRHQHGRPWYRYHAGRQRSDYMAKAALRKEL